MWMLPPPFYVFLLTLACLLDSGSEAAEAANSSLPHKFLRSNARVAFVVPFFGTLPRWFPLFARTAAYNSPTFTWLIFTNDNATASNTTHVGGYLLPPNVQLHPMSLPQFYSLLSARLNMTLRPPIKSPCKMCDLKVFWGHIFEAYLQEYDFWGYTDIDLFLGNLSYFITPELLAKSDVISSYGTACTGHCTLFRRTPTVNRLPFQIRQWRRSLTYRYYDVLDEWWGHTDSVCKAVRRAVRKAALVLSKGRNAFRPKSVVQEDIYYPCRKFRCQKLLPPAVRITWREGRMWRSSHPNFPTSAEAEVIYYHFHRTKLDITSSYDPAYLHSPKFCVTGTHRLALEC